MKNLLISLFILSCISTCFAQSFFESKTEQLKDSSSTSTALNFSGEVEASIYSSKNLKDYQMIRSSFNYKTQYKHKYSFAQVEIRGIQSLIWNEKLSEIKIREAYAGYKRDHFRVSLGQQIVQWGKGDGFNPSNNLNPKDYFYLSSVNKESIIPNFMLRSTFIINPEWSVECIILPQAKTGLYRFDLLFPDDNIIFHPNSFEKATLSKSQLAFKVEANYHSWSLSLSAYRGYDPLAGYYVSKINWNTTLPDLEFKVQAHRKNSLGFNAEYVMGSFIFRTELAYDHSEDHVDNMHIPAPALHYVINMEKAWGSWNSIFQYIGTHSFDFKTLEIPVLENPNDPLAQMQYQEELVYHEAASFNRKLFHRQKGYMHAFSLFIQRAFYFDQLDVQWMSYYSLSTGDLLLKPSLSYQFSDSMSMTAGYNYLHAEEGELFSYVGPILSSAFFEFRIIF